MSFDARSRERLAALGRTLPQKLPLPSTTPSPAPSARKADTAPRHRVEIEENPEDLFRALMQASADGSVPPHLLERLRELEATQPSRRPGAPGAPNSISASPNPSGAAQPQDSTRPPSAKPRRPTANRNAPPPRRASGPERELYDAFDDLLHLEHDDATDPLPSPRRPADQRLAPKPTLRQERAGR